MEENTTHYILVYPSSHKHLGLFNDLCSNSQIECISVKQKPLQNRLLRLLKKIHTSGSISEIVNLPLKGIWYQKIEFHLDEKEEYCIIIDDAAIKAFSPTYLNKIFSSSKVRGVLILVNSINAHSTSMNEVRRKINKIDWDDIYTFDPVDEKQFGYKPLKWAYYSKKELSDERIIENDVYFIGGFKGKRKELVLSIFEKLDQNGVCTNFNIMIAGKEKLKKLFYENKINYYFNTWISYDCVLENVLKSNVILEVLQEGQAGPSLRYYEAICYNRKLITNNKWAAELPYYNADFIKIIDRPEDIDIDWAKRRDDVDYGYKGDFSPIHLLDIVRK